MALSNPLNIGVIGLGVMGQRMLARLAQHDRLQAVVAWDADPAARARARQAHPALRFADDAQAVIASPGLHGIYIATPPAPHMQLSNLAFDAGLAVLCEKPLTVDAGDAQRTIARIAEGGHRAAVNFSLASSAGLAALQEACRDGSGSVVGAVQRVSIELAFAAWPRPWQAAAGAWLGQRAEGGFTREVLSHFIFVLQRALGPARVLRSTPVYPADGLSAERALQAQLSTHALPVPVPVAVDARVGGALDDVNRFTLTGSAGELQLHDWFGLRQRRHGQDWQSLGDAQALRTSGQAGQLDQWVALIEGRPHGLPGYAEAWAVQQTIETLLAGVNPDVERHGKTGFVA
jgi:predicted dehydrogenase